MTRKELARDLLLAALIVSTMVWTFNYALAQENTVPCPNNIPCKVIVLTEEQVATLDQIIANTALQGPYAQLHQVVQFYREVLAKAPPGKFKPVENKP